MRPMLEFDDAGAGDDEPAKGVKLGHLREWHDEMERLRSELHSIAAHLAFGKSQAIKARDNAHNTIEYIIDAEAATVSALTSGERDD